MRSLLLEALAHSLLYFSFAVMIFGRPGQLIVLDVLWEQRSKANSLRSIRWGHCRNQHRIGNLCCSRRSVLSPPPIAARGLTGKAYRMHYRDSCSHLKQIYLSFDNMVELIMALADWKGCQKPETGELEI